jgi:hypothetical protein
VIAFFRAASPNSLPGLVCTTTICFSRLTTTSTVAGFLRSSASMPCAQKPHTMPNTFISMVSACAAKLAASRTRARQILLFMGFTSRD